MCIYFCFPPKNDPLKFYCSSSLIIRDFRPGKTQLGRFPTVTGQRHGMSLTSLIRANKMMRYLKTCCEWWWSTTKFFNNICGKLTTTSCFNLIPPRALRVVLPRSLSLGYNILCVYCQYWDAHSLPDLPLKVWIPKQLSSNPTHCSSNMYWTQAIAQSDTDLHLNPHRVQEILQRVNAIPQQANNPGLLSQRCGRAELLALCQTQERAETELNDTRLWFAF